MPPPSVYPSIKYRRRAFKGGLDICEFSFASHCPARLNVKQMQEEEEEALGRSPTQQGHTEDQTVQLSVERPNLRGSITA